MSLRIDNIPPDGILIAEDAFVTGTGQVLQRVHPESACADRDHCVIHRPSDHGMREFKTHFRTGGLYDIKPPHMERVCEHGVGHPDPDDAEFWRSQGENVTVHGCDGCCS